jgi:predicted nucleotidyltransferase
LALCFHVAQASEGPCRRERVDGREAGAESRDGALERGTLSRVDLRLRTLEQLDSRSVPLPHGTEIVTRVDRIVGERRIPQGTVGRVTKADGDAIDVTVVGVGVVRYARAELTPRRVGQAIFAHRRADAWDALRACVVLDTTVGSRAWGLADESSDEDHRGVFALPFTWTQGLVAPPEDLVSEDGSATYWAVGKAIRQALRADPNTLEMLFLPNAKPLDPIGEWLLEARDAFVSIEIYGTFGRYALGQLRRLEQGLRLAEHRAVILEWLREDPTLTLDAVADKLAKISTRAAPTQADGVHQAKQYVKQLYRSMHDQGLLEANELAALARFARDKSADFDLPRELRPKNAYNLVRLLAAATHWLREGTPVFEVEGPLRDRLLAIKKGQVALDDVLAEAEAMAPALESARDVSTLPQRPDVQRADALLRRVGEELARRWVSGEPGPLGKDAPVPPEIVWSE